jgi:hypothetical protein
MISQKNKPNSNPIKANFSPISRVANPNKAKTNPIFTSDICPLALEFTLECAYLLFCRGAGTNPIFERLTMRALTWKIYAIVTCAIGSNFAMKYCDLPAEFTTLKGVIEKPNFEKVSEHLR